MKYEIEEKQAKETADRNHTKAGDLDCWEFIGDEFKAFCEQLCKEQLGKVLQLCKFSSDGNYYYATKEEILNAPMPEL